MQFSEVALEINESLIILPVIKAFLNCESTEKRIEIQQPRLRVERITSTRHQRQNSKFPLTLTGHWY